MRPISRQELRRELEALAETLNRLSLRVAEFEENSQAASDTEGDEMVEGDEVIILSNTGGYRGRRAHIVSRHGTQFFNVKLDNGGPVISRKKISLQKATTRGT